MHNTHWHLQMHFIEWNMLSFVSNFTEIVQKGLTSGKSVLAYVMVMAQQQTCTKPLTEPTSCAHKWGQNTALITTHLIKKYPIKISILQLCANWVDDFLESFRNPIFS